MSPFYNRNRAYIKKFGKFKKPYKPSYNQDLYGDIYSPLSPHLKYVNRLTADYSAFFKPNLSGLLAMIWLAQQPEYRRMYYNLCCFLTRFDTIYYKPYVEYVSDYLGEGKLTILTQHACLFKMLDSYYYTTPHFQTFKSDYFFYEHYDYPYLLSYEDYIFKNEYTVYGVLWTGVERLRQKKYNEYVRAHYILHHGTNAALRARYIIKNVIYPKGKLLDPTVNHKSWPLRLWYKFFLAAKKRKYQMVLHTLQATAGPYVAPAIYNLNSQILALYYQHSPHYINTYIWNNIGDYQKLNARWFRSMLYIPIVLNINRAFVDYIYQFPSQSRLDIIRSSDYIIAHGLTEVVYDRLVEKQMVSVKAQALSEFMLQDSMQDYLIGSNLFSCFSSTKLKSFKHLNTTLFDSHTVNLLITNDIFNRYLVTRLFSHQARILPVRIRSDSHFIDNQQLFIHIRNYILCGNYYKLPGYMCSVMGLMGYFYWRSYNTDAVHQAHKGRLHLHHYMHQLNIQTLLSQQLYNVYKVILHLWDVDQIGASAIGLAQMSNYLSINYINWLRQYSYITFFCLFKNSKMRATEDYYQQFYANKWHTSLLSHIAIRRYLNNYMTVFKRFRRAPYDDYKGTCIHGKDPARLEQWLVHVNWMRIIGLTRPQLPFYLYSYEETTDYLEELVKKTAHHHVNIHTLDLFKIQPQPGINYISQKPYIKTTNMLYDPSIIY